MDSQEDVFSVVDNYCNDNAEDDVGVGNLFNDGCSDCDEVETINSKADHQPKKRKLETPSSSKLYADKRARINRDNWNDELSATLIAHVELHPVIWDVNWAGFRNKNLKESAWIKVRTDGNLLHIDDSECRRKWQHLASHNNKLATAYLKAVSGESAKKKPDCVHWTAMEFARKNRASYQTHTHSNLVRIEL